MTTFIIRRLLLALLVVIIVSLLVFLLMRMLPGDPILMYLSGKQLQEISPQELALTREKFGLDKPLLVQYGVWVQGLLHGDLGTSLLTHQKVWALIAPRIPVTLHIGLLAFVISTLLGIVAGVLSAIRRGKWVDQAVTLLANLGITVPIFWLGILMIYLFGLKWHALPIFGYTSPFENFWLNVKQLVMPVFCETIFGLSATARQTRSSVLEVIQQDYIRTAWSKGLVERVVIIKHVLKNALIPVVTLSGMGLSQILGGAVLIEMVFSIPGMGRLAVDALFALDYPITQGVVLLTAIMVVSANLIVDISYGWLDPRVRYG
jgi:peptide/nickel transport system permease protein